MRVSCNCTKSIGLILLAMTIVTSGVIVNAYAFPGYGPNIPAFNFTITASTALIKIQPGMSGALVIWVDLYCPNSTSTIRCDSTILQTVNLQILGGCPAGAYCILDRTQLLAAPIFAASSEFFVYSFSSAPSGASTVTVIGTDQFGQTHTAQFGVIVCNC
jgi:hypothetical protein